MVAVTQAFHGTIKQSATIIRHHRAEKQAVALSAADTFAAAAIDFINQYAKKKTRH